jgi:hypothetical protein
MVIPQHLSIGMMPWMSQMPPEESWAAVRPARCRGMLDEM